MHESLRTLLHTVPQIAVIDLSQQGRTRRFACVVVIEHGATSQQFSHVSRQVAAELGCRYDESRDAIVVADKTAEQIRAELGVKLFGNRAVIQPPIPGLERELKR